MWQYDQNSDTKLEANLWTFNAGIGGKTDPFPIVWVFRVVRQIVTAQYCVESDLDRHWEFGTIANTNEQASIQVFSEEWGEYILHPPNVSTPATIWKAWARNNIFSPHNGVLHSDCPNQDSAQPKDVLCWLYILIPLRNRFLWEANDAAVQGHLGAAKG